LYPDFRVLKARYQHDDGLKPAPPLCAPQPGTIGPGIAG
jgi:hypothetical protein